MIGIFLLISALTLLYILAIKPYSYWATKNVRTGKITPIFGENLPVILGKESFLQMLERIYKMMPDVRYLGFYQFSSPGLLIRSPELIKQICVKDFDHFVNHKQHFPDYEPLFSKNLFTLKGQAWKDMRAIITPSFTGSRMRSMFTLMCRTANVFIQHFIEKGEDIVEVEFKDAYTRYANDVIATAGFGIQVDSLKDRQNEFYTLGKECASFSTGWKKMLFFLYMVSPKIFHLFKVPFFGKKAELFYMKLVNDIIKMREEQNIKRTDIIGLLIEAKNGQQEQSAPQEINETNTVVEEQTNIKNLTINDIAPQVFTFFIAGFESISSAMCFMSYELAINPDVQKKLIEEIDANRPVNGTPSYETVMNMTYMDMVVSETLRKWPTAGAADRSVNKPYTIQPELPGEKPVHLDISDNVFIATFAIHRDPKYYKNPEKFDPERFSIENKKNIDPYTYMPFGVGPRHCIADRLALLEIKVIFFHLLSYFEIIPVEKTQIPLIMSTSSITLNPVNGFPLGLKRRN